MVEEYTPRSNFAYDAASNRVLGFSLGPVGDDNAYLLARPLDGSGGQHLDPQRDTVVGRQPTFIARIDAGHWVVADQRANAVEKGKNRIRPRLLPFTPIFVAHQNSS